jgi:hypothetical protein
METHTMQMTAGEKVGRAGVYCVIHKGHRPSHASILQQGEVFPVCRVCGSAVRFDFTQPLAESDEVEHIGYDRDFMDAVLGARHTAS